MPILGLLLVLLACGSAYAETRGGVSLRQDSFVSSDYTSTQAKSFGFIGGHIQSRPDENGFFSDIHGEFVPQTPMMSYLNVRELYYRDTFVGVGRKLYTWSRLDEDFHMGLVQPQFRWNPLDSSSQGLTGISLQFDNQILGQPWGLHLFASFLHVPDQGASFQMKDGQFEAANPWFRTPPQRAQFDDQGQVIDQIQYEIQKPTVNEVVSNSSFVGAVHLGEPEKGFWIQGMSAYKPSPQLAIGTDGVLKPNNTVDVKIVPKVYYHSLLGADLQYSFTNLQFGASGLQEHPRDPDFDSRLTYNRYEASTLSSVYMGIRAGKLKTQISQLQVQGGQATAVGPKAKELVSVLPERYPFRSATQVTALYEYKWKRFEGLTGQATYLQGKDNEFEFVKLSLGWQFDSRWTLQGAGLLVKADARSKSVYSEYQDNDQVQLGVNYVF